MMARSLLISLALLGAFFEGARAGLLQEWVGLRLPGRPRELQEEVFNLCASAFSGNNNHLLANLDKKGNVLAKWVPIEDEDFNAIVDLGDGTFTLSGRVIPRGDDDLDNALTIQFTYSNPVSAGDCFCASEEFLGDLTTIDYDRIQRQCTLENYLARSEDAQDLQFCPFCQEDQCKIAAENSPGNGAPDPIYQDWIFFTEVSGSLSGPGLELFRDLIEKGFKSYDIDEDIDSCTPDITNQPLPQLHCTDYETPEIGFGYGVNGKNQRCGFSTWFNCAEDLPQLGGDDVMVKVADINLDLITCPLPETPLPTPEVTALPTVSPTVQPTVSPTPCPKKPCKFLKVCVPCEYFPEDETCGEDGAGWIGDWADEDWIN